jgi:AcrR family transcriptional regulator
MTAGEIREKAIFSAIERIRRHGVEKVRLVDIAKDVGVSHVALYSHFADKAALLDCVSELWVQSVDALLEQVCQKKKDPLEKIQEYFLKLHLAKLEKVQEDPEVYKAFDMAVDSGKAFIESHLKTMVRQVTGLVKEAMAARKIRKEAPEKVAAMLITSTMGFTHPKLVAQFLHEKREPLLKRILEAILAGLA